MGGMGSYREKRRAGQNRKSKGENEGTFRDMKVKGKEGKGKMKRVRGNSEVNLRI